MLDRSARLLPNRRWFALALLCTFLITSIVVAAPPAALPAALPNPPINPTPQWANAGCYASWCQTGWYASPAVADLDGDGAPEVIWGGYSINVVDGATGTLRWSVRAGHDRSYTGTEDVGRTWPGIVIADIDNDGAPEIVTAHGAGWVGVYDRNGYWKPGWPRRPYTAEIRSLAVDDLDNDRRMEIVVARASSGSYNQWTVLQADGSTRPGWPRLSDQEPGYGWGAYNQNVGVADIDSDGRSEIVGPSDVHYISAFNDDGSQIRANARYGPKFWSQVGTHLDDAVDVRGYANCGAEHRPNFANSAPTLVDLDRNGTREVIVIGNVYNCGTDPYTDLGYVPFIFNADRSRWNAGAFNWTSVPPLGGDIGAPLSQDYNVIQNAMPNPVVADLDGDGTPELLHAAYDGKLHAWWLSDKTERGAWPLNVTQLAGDLSFASEPIVADLDNDGTAEVIVGTWPRNGGRRVGKLIVADWQGNVVQQIALPAPRSSDANAWNGALGAPTIANIDGDANLEIVVGTVSSGIVAYEVQGSAAARIVWGTGRGSFRRTGALPAAPITIRASTDRSRVAPGETVQFRLQLSNESNAPIAPLQLNVPLPPNLEFAGGLSAGRGTISQQNGAIMWNGSVPAGPPVMITFAARVNPALTGPTTITTSGQLSGGQSMRADWTVVVNGNAQWLPLAQR